MRRSSASFSAWSARTPDEEKRVVRLLVRLQAVSASSQIVIA